MREDVQSVAESPIVSIVIRTKDRDLMLARAVDDVLAQTFGAWEAILVNDGGDPDLVDGVLAARSADLASRARVVHLPRSGGMEAASNAGVQLATAQYLVIHDDDDTWDPEFLARTVAHLQANPDALAVAVSTEIVVERAEGAGFVEVERRSFVPPGESVSLFDLLTTNRVVPIGLLVRRDVVDDLGGFDESLDVVGDWDFNLRLVTRGRVDYLPGPPLAQWRQRPSATGSSANSMFAARAEHTRFDRIVRDRALRAEAAEIGLGTPLFVARLVDEAEQRIIRHLDRRLDALEAQLCALQETRSGRVRRALRRVAGRPTA